jgi:hypothetical protein
MFAKCDSQICVNLNSQLVLCTTVFNDLHFGVMPWVSIEAFTKNGSVKLITVFTIRRPYVKKDSSELHNKNIVLFLNNWFVKQKCNQVFLLENSSQTVVHS